MLLFVWLSLYYQGLGTIAGEIISGGWWVGIYVLHEVFSKDERQDRVVENPGERQY